MPAIAEQPLLATILHPAGLLDSISLPEDEKTRLEKLQEIVGGYIEVIALPGQRYMLINEDGKSSPHAVNDIATLVAHDSQSISRADYIAGTAVIVSHAAVNNPPLNAKAL